MVKIIKCNYLELFTHNLQLYHKIKIFDRLQNVNYLLSILQYYLQL